MYIGYLRDLSFSNEEDEDFIRERIRVRGYILLLQVIVFVLLIWIKNQVKKYIYILIDLFFGWVI